MHKNPQNHTVEGQAVEGQAVEGQAVEGQALEGQAGFRGSWVMLPVYRYTDVAARIRLGRIPAGGKRRRAKGKECFCGDVGKPFMDTEINR